jgi:hypothetical protein
LRSPEGSEFVAELGLLSGRSFREERPYWRGMAPCNLEFLAGAAGRFRVTLKSLPFTG